MTMQRFQATLVAGGKAPYTTWTFVVFPPEVVAAWSGSSRPALRVRIAGQPFRGTASRGEGVLRMPVPRELREATGLGVGDRVQVQVEVDPEPRPVEVPEAPQAVLDGDAELAAAFTGLAPACRRAWAEHVGEAKRAETRQRRADKAAEGIRAKLFSEQRG